MSSLKTIDFWNESGLFEDGDREMNQHKETSKLFPTSQLKYYQLIKPRACRRRRIKQNQREQ